MKFQNYLLVLLGVILLIIYIFRPWPELGLEAKYQILTELLVILLAFAGIIGWGIYKLIQSKIIEDVKEERNLSKAENLLNVGYSIWCTYKKTQREDKRCELLNKSIQLTEKALELVESTNKEVQIRQERFILNCQNNLVYYLSERKDPKDKEKIRALLKVLIEKKHKFPNFASNWADTIEFVKNRLAEIGFSIEN